MKYSNRAISIFSFSILALTITSCSSESGYSQPPVNPIVVYPPVVPPVVTPVPAVETLDLVFQSGFEGTTAVIGEGGTDFGAEYERLSGIDNTFTTKNNWNTDWPNGKMQVQYTGGNSTQRSATVITDPTKSGNKVFRFWLNEGWKADLNLDKARIQTNIYGIKGGYKEFRQSVRVYLTEDFNVLKGYPDIINWITLSEFWNNVSWEAQVKFGYRFGLMINKFTKGRDDLYFVLHAENLHNVNGDAERRTLWAYENKTIKVPVGKWFTMDYYFKEGNKNNGRFYMAITPEGESKQIVFDVHDITYNEFDPNPDGLTDFNPLKLYTSKGLIDYVKSQGKTLQIYWDDYQLWKK